MTPNLNRELSDQWIRGLQLEAEAVRLARSVRRARAKTLRHNRRVLRLRGSWSSTFR
jgi:hypothetical protein